MGIVGLIVVFLCVASGYAIHGGNFTILFQISEFLIIGGAGLGGFLLANPIPVIKKSIAGAIEALKGGYKIKKEQYLESLRMLYELFQLAKRDGLIALEPHVENPESSTIFTKYEFFLKNHHAVNFLADTFKVILQGGVPVNELEELMDVDLETIEKEEEKPSSALTTMADSFPGLGIVAAVLGVIITMGKIDQPPEVIGHSIAAALVGTFLGILLSYGVVGPIAKNTEHNNEARMEYLRVLKAGILSFVRGMPPLIAVEYARRAISTEYRPTFQEMEESVKQRG